MKTLAVGIAFLISLSSFAASGKCTVYSRSDAKKETIEISLRAGDYTFLFIDNRTNDIIPEFQSVDYETEFETQQYVALSDGRELICKVDGVNGVENFCAEVSPGSSRVQTFFLVPEKTKICRYL